MSEQNNATIQRLTQDAISLSLAGKHLAESIDSITSYTQLDLSWTHLYEMTPQQFSMLQDKFAQPLINLNLSNNFIETFDQKQTACITQFIKICSPHALNLKALLLHEYPHRKQLFENLSTLSNLSTLILSHGELGIQAEFLTETITYLSNMKLKILDLSHNEFWRLNETHWQIIIDYIKNAGLHTIRFDASDIVQMPTYSKHLFIAALNDNKTQLIVANLSRKNAPILYDYAHPVIYPPSLFSKENSPWNNGRESTNDTYTNILS